MRRVLVGTAAVLVVLFVAAAGAIAWLFGTEAGLRWAIAQAESHAGGSLRIEGASGTLASVVTLAHVHFDSDGTVIDARDIGAHAHLAAALGGRLAIEPLRIATLDISIAAGGERASGPPLIPFSVSLSKVDIERLRIMRGEATYAFRKVRLAGLSLGALPPASIAAEGSFEYEDERYPVRGTLALGGTLERLQTRLALRQDELKADIEAVLAPYRPQHLVTLEARAAPIDPSRLQAELPRAALSLEIKASGGERSIGGTLALSNSAPGPLDEGRLPIASVNARVTSRDLQSATLEELRIVLAGGGELEGGGELDPAGFRGTLRATRLNLRALRSTLRRTELSGPLEVDVRRDTQSVKGTLAQAGMSVTADAVRSGDTVDIRSLRAAAQGGEVSGTGHVRLTDPLAFDAKLALERFDPAEFGDYPRGAISGNVTAQGTLGAEPRIAAQWTVANSMLVDLPLATRGQARLAGRRLVQGEAELSLGTSRATAHGSFGAVTDQLAWTLEVPNLEEHLDGVAGRMKAEGLLGGTWQAPHATVDAQFQALELPYGYKIASASVDLGGTAARHEARFAVRTNGAELTTALRGAFAGGVWSGDIITLEGRGRVPVSLRAPAPLKISRGRVELGRFEAALGDGQLLVRELAWSKEKLATSGEFTGLPAQWLVAAAGLSERLRATLLLDGQWQLSAGSGIDGSLRVRRRSGDLSIVDERPVDLELESLALDARFTNQGVGARLDAVSKYATAALAGQLGRDPAAGILGLGTNSALLVQGQVELSRARVLVQPVLSDARFDGHVSADIEASGTVGAPVITGAVRGDGLSFDYPPYGVYLKNGELRARLERDRLQVERFAIQAGDGTFTATGTLPLRFADGNAKIAWQAKSFGVLERPDMRLIASGEGEIGFDGKRLSLGGELRADRGHLEIAGERMPKLGDDVIIVGQPRPDSKARSPLPIDLNVDLDLGSNLSVNVHGLEGKLTGRLNVKTTQDGELRAYGKLTTLNATFFAYGQRLQVDPGVLIFDGPIDNPTLQITAWRRNQAVEAGVQVSGTVSAPRVQIVSQPQVSEGERLSWLVLGRAPTDATKADLGLLQAAAGALLARGDSMPLDRRIAQSFGLDEVSFRGTGELQDRVLAFGKRVSDKLYVSYEQGLGTVASNLVKLDYSLSRRWSVRAETGTSSGMSLFYRFSWD